VVRILIPDFQPVGEPGLERETAGAEIGLDVFRKDAPIEAWSRADGAVVYHEVAVGPVELEKAALLRIVVRAGVGFDNIDLAACGARGIPVCNTPDYGTTDVADHAIAMLLTLTRGTAIYDETLRADPVGGWRFAAAPVVRRLRGGVFGVIGLGRIGTATALRARGFGMEIVFYDPFLPEGADLALGFRRARNLTALLGEADVVSVHAPLTAETRDMIDRAAVAAMKPGTILVNTARGPICALDALADGLRNGRLAGVALDVLPEEPPSPDDPLVSAWRRGEPWAKGRLLLSPHAAFYSAAGFADLRRKSIETAIAYLHRGELRNCVNLEYLKLPIK
jgi:D-3-phosphoglycerate dehydrogenase/C-terminal binding protein